MREVPLKRLAAIRVSNVDKKTSVNDQPVRLCNYTDVYYRDVIRPEQDFMSATASREQVLAFRLQPDDVIITKDSETPDDIGVPSYVEASAGDLVCGYHLAIIRPISSLIHGRFLFWSMASTTVREQFAVVATGVTRFGLRTDSIGAVMIGWPAMPLQLAIADFLASETARIDALIAKKQWLLRLLADRRTALREQAFGSSPGWALKRLLRAGMAYGVLVPRFVDAGGGARMVRINALRPDGRVDGDRLPWIDTQQSFEYRRTIVTSGDLVLSVVGSMGRSAVIDSDAVGANLNRPLARLQPRNDLPSRLLWHWTQTPQFRDQAALSTGGDTAQPTLNLGDLAEFRVGLPDDPTVWEEVLRALERKLAPLNRAEELMTGQVGLLLERRQALITAAVTGQLDIPRAA